MRNLCKLYIRLVILVTVISPLAALAPRSRAMPTFTIKLVNQSALEIRRFYLSPADNDNWGPDQLNETAISPGATRTLDVSWDQSTVKLVAEDQDGCFLNTTVAATGNPVWTINSDTPRDCGS
jgi:hypothetical protein